MNLFFFLALLLSLNQSYVLTFSKVKDQGNQHRMTCVSKPRRMPQENHKGDISKIKTRYISSLCVFYDHGCHFMGHCHTHRHEGDSPTTALLVDGAREM